MLRRAVLILVLVLAGCGGLTAMEEQRSGDVMRGRVVDVVDGDTLKVRLDGEVETVRLLGIDTPETRRPGTPVECGGAEATSRMLELAFSRPRDRDGDGLFDSEGGRGIALTLETDPSQDTRDRFDRLLAYTEPGLQRRMLESGWAEVTCTTATRSSGSSGSARPNTRRARAAAASGDAAAVTSTRSVRRRGGHHRPHAFI